MSEDMAPADDAGDTEDVQLDELDTEGETAEDAPAAPDMNAGSFAAQSEDN